MTDNELLAAFENGALPFAQWNHRAHVRVAFLYASRYPLAEATARMRTGVQAYNAANHVPVAIDRGYHETTTQAFMRLIHAAACQHRGSIDFDLFCQHHPELLDRRVLLCYYSRDRIMDEQAKACFVEPDLAPLDQAGLSYPEFGPRQPGADYVLRPGSYAVIADHAARIALVVTPAGVYLPGGGQEPGESALQALHREALEECGLTLRVVSPIGAADEFVFAEQESQYFCKRCSFYQAEALAQGRANESDHTLTWVPCSDAIRKLTSASHRWAVSQSERKR